MKWRRSGIGGNAANRRRQSRRGAEKLAASKSLATSAAASVSRWRHRAQQRAYHSPQAYCARRISRLIITARHQQWRRQQWRNMARGVASEKLWRSSSMAAWRWRSVSSRRAA